MSRPRDAAQGRAGSRTSARTISSAAQRYRYNVSFSVDATKEEAEGLAVAVANAVDCRHVGAIIVSPAGAACVHHYVMVSGGMRCKKCGHVMGQPERPGDAAAHIEPRLRPPTRLERFAFRITRRWPDSYVAARLNYADELRAAAQAKEHRPCRR